MKLKIVIKKIVRNNDGEFEKQWDQDLLKKRLNNCKESERKSGREKI